MGTPLAGGDTGPAGGDRLALLAEILVECVDIVLLVGNGAGGPALGGGLICGC
jgi:hypothetical protein